MRKQMKKVSLLLVGIGASVFASGQIAAAPAFLPQGAMPGYTPASLNQGYATFRPRYNQRAFSQAPRTRPYYYMPRPAAFNGPGRFAMPRASMPHQPRYAAAWPQHRGYGWTAPVRFNPVKPAARYIPKGYGMNTMARAPFQPSTTRQMAYRPQFGTAVPGYRFRPQAPAQAVTQHKQVGYQVPSRINPAYRFRPWGRPVARAVTAPNAQRQWQAYPAFGQAYRPSAPYPAHSQFRPTAPVAVFNQRYARSLYPQVQTRMAYANPGVGRYRPDPRFVQPFQQGMRWPVVGQKASMAMPVWQQNRYSAYKWRPIESVSEGGLAQNEMGRNF